MLSFIKKLFYPSKHNAALAWQQAGNQAESAFWLYAMPVHLVLQRDTFSLAEPVPLLLENFEIEALTGALNKHFEADGCQFYWHQNTWFLSLQTNPQIATKPPQLAINKDIRAFLPTGEGAAKWASFTNELQMLLFEHPINIVRETKRLPVVNSLWFYGLGQLNVAVKS